MSVGGKRARRDRESGLTFAWRIPESSRWAGFAAFVIIGLLTTALFATVRVRVMPPPRLIERKASAVLIREDVDGRAWAVRAEEEGPFPARFDPRESVAFQTIETNALEALRTKPGKPIQLKDLPPDSASSSLAVASRGERVFPPQPPLEEKPMPVDLPPLVPAMSVLSALPANALPQKFPEFEGVPTPAMTAKTWRFTLEIGKGGRVTDQIALDGSDESSARAIADWLSQVRFGPAASDIGWIGVEVSFNRKP